MNSYCYFFLCSVVCVFLSFDLYSMKNPEKSYASIHSQSVIIDIVCAPCTSLVWECVCLCWFVIKFFFILGFCDVMLVEFFFRSNFHRNIWMGLLCSRAPDLSYVDLTWIAWTKEESHTTICKSHIDGNVFSFILYYFIFIGNVAACWLLWLCHPLLY